MLIKLALLQRRHLFLKQRLAAAASAPPNVVLKGSLPHLPPAFAAMRGALLAELGDGDARRLYVPATLLVARFRSAPDCLISGGGGEI